MKTTPMLAVAVLATCAFVAIQSTKTVANAPGGTVKVGVVDAQQIIQKSERGQAVQKKLETYQNKKSTELKAEQAQIKKLEKELLSRTLSGAARESKNIELQTKRTQLKRDYEDAQGESQRLSQKELIKLEKEIVPILNQVGKAKGFTIIFDLSRSGLVYFDSSTDITADVIKAIDARH